MLRSIIILLSFSSLTTITFGQSLKPIADTFVFENEGFSELEIEMSFTSWRKWHVQNDGHGGASAPNFILEKKVNGSWIEVYRYFPGFILDYAVQTPVNEVEMHFRIPFGEQAMAMDMYGEFGDVPISNGNYRVKIKLDHSNKKRVKMVESKPFQVQLKM